MKVIDKRNQDNICKLADLGMGDMFEVLEDSTLGGRYFLYGDGKIVDLSSGRFYYITLFQNKKLRLLNATITVND